jgi:hypothetical protein
MSRPIQKSAFRESVRVSRPESAHNKGWSAFGERMFVEDAP